MFAVVAFPVYWMVATSFKQGGEILSFTPQFIPTNPTLDNFRDAISRDLFWSSVRNSLIVVVAVVVVSVVLAFLAALALAKFRFHGRNAFVVVVFGVQMVPLAVSPPARSTRSRRRRPTPRRWRRSRSSQPTPPAKGR